MGIKIKKARQGFVPQHKSHNMTLCAFYHCCLPRHECRRYCKMHAKQYDKEAQAQGGASVIRFDPNN